MGAREAKQSQTAIKGKAVIKDRKVTLHSTRHTFADRARKEWAMPIDILDRWGGWFGSGGMSQRVYGGRLEVSDFAPYRDKVVFGVLEEVDNILDNNGP